MLCCTVCQIDGCRSCTMRVVNKDSW